MCIDTGMVLSITVGILSILVVVLIGWQIYSVFDIRRDIREIKSEVSGAIKRINLESERLSTAVYVTIFDGILKKGKEVDVYGYFKYGLLVILHAESCENIQLCHSMIQVLKESFPVSQPIKNQEKAYILSTASKISETSIGKSFGELHDMIITQMPSID